MLGLKVFKKADITEKMSCASPSRETLWIKGLKAKDMSVHGQIINMSLCYSKPERFLEKDSIFKLMRYLI